MSDLATQNTQLRSALSEALDVIVTMSGADDFATDGVAGEFWAKFRDERLDALIALADGPAN